MKEKQTLLDDLWCGNAHYCLLMIKGNGIRFVITKQDVLADDDRSHRMATECTLMAAMKHWEKLLPQDDGDELELIS